MEIGMERGHSLTKGLTNNKVQAMKISFFI